MSSQPIVAYQVGVMWTQLKHMLERQKLKKNVTANMMVLRADFVKCLWNLFALINALGMATAVADFVR